MGRPEDIPGFTNKGYLGGGPNGEVYSGTFKGKPAAAKLFHFPIVGGDFESIKPQKNFNVPFHTDVGHKSPYQVTPLRRESLGAYFEKNPPHILVVDWLRQAADALNALAVQQRIHGRVKPANLLVGDDTQIYLADFGQTPGTGDGRITLDDIWYVPPERASGGPPSGAWDVYSLGATFYHLLAGVPPRADESVREALKKSKRDEARLRLYQQYLEQAQLEAPDRIKPGIDGKLAELIEDCLAADPQERPSISQVQERARAIPDQPKPRPKPPPPKIQAEQKKAKAQARASRKFVLKKEAVMGLAAVALVAILGLGFWSVRRGYKARAQDYLAQGQRLFEQEKEGAVLYFAQAAYWDPHSREIREAAARCFQERPRLAFYERVEGPVTKTGATQGRSVTVGSDHATVREGSKSVRLLAGAFASAKLGPRGRYVVTVGKDGTTTVWDADGAGYRTLPGPADKVVFAPQGEQVVILQGDRAQAYDCSSGEALGHGVRGIEDLGFGEAGEVVFKDRSGQHYRGPAQNFLDSSPWPPDLDQPTELLKIEAQLYSQGFLDGLTGRVQPFKEPDLAALRSKWEQEAAGHTAECGQKKANLYLRYRAPTAVATPKKATP